MECWTVHVLPSCLLSFQGYLHRSGWLCQFDGSTCTPLNQDLGQIEITLRFGIFTILADCAKLMVVHVLLWVLILGQTKLFNLLYGLLAYVLIFQVYFIIETWVVHVLLWILILGQSKLFYFVYGMMDRVGSTCTTSRSFFIFKAIFTFLADYAKLMVVHVLLWILIYGGNLF